MRGQGHQIFVDELARFATSSADQRVVAIAQRAAEPLRVAVRGRPGVGCRTVARALQGAGSSSGMTVTPQARAADSDVDLVVYVTVEVVKPEDREAIAATRRPVVAVLNKADLAGPLSGAGPIVMAQARCAQFSTLLGVPMESMIGLLAVAALDDLDDTLRAALRALAAHPDGFDALDRAVAGFLAAALPVPTEVRLRLLDTLGAAAAPELGEPYLDDLVAAIQKQLADPAVARRNMLRAWESRLLMVARRFDGDAQSAGRRARVDALRQQRRTVLRQGRQSKSEHTIALRAQIQHARVKLSYFARNRCSLLRVELQEHVAGLSRKDIARFAAYTRGRVQEVVAEVGEGAVAHLADVAQLLGVPVQPPVLENLPAVLPTVVAPPLTSRRLEIRLTTLLGAGFGLGIALTLSRLVAGLTPGLAASGMVAGVAIGLAVTAWVVNARALLHDRVVVDRWTGEVTASLRSVVEQLVATRVVAVETLLSTAISERDDAENARVADQVSIIDGELREHAVAAARAAALRDREMPAVRAALEAVRAELGEPGTPTTGLF